MDETNGSWFPRERQNSNPFHFTSGHEVSRSNSATNIYGNSSFTAFPEKAETKFSPKPGKRTRKLSLFSFHFNSKSNSEERGKVRRSSQPAFHQPSPTTLSPDPDVWMASLKPTGSQNSLDSSPSSSRKCWPTKRPSTSLNATAPGPFRAATASSSIGSAAPPSPRVGGAL